VRAAKPDSVQIFIAPPNPAVLRERLIGRGTDSTEAIDERLKVAEQELSVQDDFDHQIVNDEVERAAGELVEVVRSELGLDSASL
jgi:guanylate kinase